jgi:hypothetical protein
VKRRLAVVALLLAALVAADRALSAREAARRAEATRIGHLFSESERTSGQVAALRVETGRGESLFYGQVGGVWRCLSWRQAVADAEAVVELAAAIADAVGYPVAADPARPAEFGLDERARTRVTLHGPAATPLDPRRDVVLAVDIGRSFPDGSGCYVRRVGQRAVWSVDTSPGDLLERADARQPPLLDGRIVPASWPGTTPRVQALQVEIAGAPAYELLLRARPVREGLSDPTRPDVEWVLRAGDEERPCAGLLVLFYVDHLLEARWQGLVDQVLAPHLGFERPRARVTLRSGDAEPLQLVLGMRRPGGGSVVAGSTTGLLYEVPPEQEPLLFPAAEAFAPDATSNPWDG